MQTEKSVAHPIIGVYISKMFDNNDYLLKPIRKEVEQLKKELEAKGVLCIAADEVKSPNYVIGLLGEDANKIKFCGIDTHGNIFGNSQLGGHTA